MSKRIVAIIFVITVIFSLTTMASAATSASTVSTTLDRANALKELGLFMGSSAGFDLDKAPTRTEAVIMLLRVLGEEKAAQSSSYENPFTDVPAWAVKEVTYAYNKGYTSGLSSNKFGSTELVTPEQFFTFMLRALGYSDKADGDFVWNASIQKAESLGIVPPDKYKTGTNFTRGDCVDIIYSFLGANKKDGTTTLAKSLIDKGTIDSNISAKYGFTEPTNDLGLPLLTSLRFDTAEDWDAVLDDYSFVFYLPDHFNKHDDEFKMKAGDVLYDIVNGTLEDIDPTTKVYKKAEDLASKYKNLGIFVTVVTSYEFVNGLFVSSDGNKALARVQVNYSVITQIDIVETGTIHVFIVYNKNTDETKIIGFSREAIRLFEYGY